MRELGRTLEMTLRRIVKETAGASVMPSVAAPTLSDWVDYFEKVKSNVERALQVLEELPAQEIKEIARVYNEMQSYIRREERKTTPQALQRVTTSKLIPNLRKLHRGLSQLIEYLSLAMTSDAMSLYHTLLKNVKTCYELVEKQHPELDYLVSHVNMKLGVIEGYDHTSAIDALLHSLLRTLEDTFSYSLDTLDFAEFKHTPGEAGGLLPVHLRNKAARDFLSALQQITYEGKTVEEIHKELKRELSEALGGESIVLTTQTQPLSDDVFQSKFMKVKDKILSAIKKELTNNIEKLLALLPQDAAEALRGEIITSTVNRIAEYWQERAKELLTGGSQELKANFSEYVFKHLLDAASEIVPREKLARWTPGRLETFLGRLKTTIGTILDGIKMNDRYTVIILLSTRLEDFLRLGTKHDVNIASCFWTGAGAHSIPALLLATNVGVGFAFLYPGDPPANLQTFEDIAGIKGATLVGRFLLIVEKDGKVRIKKENNYWHDIANQLQIPAIVDKIVRSLNLKVRSRTKWLYKTPAA